MPLEGKHRNSLFILICLCVQLVLASPVSADADDESGKLLDRMANARHPQGLTGFTCHAEMETTIEGEELDALSALAMFEMPVVGMNITYLAPFDFRVEIENSPIPEVDDLVGIRLRGDDPLTLSNPGLKQALLAAYEIKYIGEGIHSGQVCAILRLTPEEETTYRPPFDLYIRKSDYLPIYTEMTLPYDDEKIEFRSEIEYALVEGFLLPSVIETRADFDKNSELVMTTTFSDYKVNTVTLMESEKKTQGSGDLFQFSDIYHGFEEPEMMVNLSEDSKPYSKLRFAFALEVSSDDVSDELDKMHPKVVEDVRAALEGRKWADLDSRKYEVGRELMDLINGILNDGMVTDFYFTIFQAER
jgi:flagellar basal body-associated protein FliL